MSTQQLLHRSSNVQRSAFLHEYFVIHTLTVLKCLKDINMHKYFKHLPCHDACNETRTCIFFEEKWTDDKRCRNSAPHSDISRKDSRLLKSSNFVHFQNFANGSRHHQTTEYSIAVRCPLLSGQDIMQKFYMLPSQQAATTAHELACICNSAICSVNFMHCANRHIQLSASFPSTVILGSLFVCF